MKHLIVALLLVACGGKTEGVVVHPLADAGTGGAYSGGTYCQPGSVLPCDCSKSRTGSAICAPDGRSVSECACASFGGATGSGGAMGTSSTGGFTGTPSVCSEALGGSPECAECACANCVQGSADCGRTPGCGSILACAAKTGCRRDVDCNTPGVCKEAIDAAGGPFSSAGFNFAVLLNCVVGAGCPCSP